MSNQFTYNPPFTEEELYDAYVVQGLNQTEVAQRFGTTQKVVWRAMQKMGIPARRAAPRNQAGSLNNNWRGGRLLQGKRAERNPINDRGYWYIYDPTHTHATKAGYVAEHIVIATTTIGRSLKKTECVHHINLQKEDNRAENLIVVTRTQHGLLHAQLEAAAAQLLDAGLVTFSLDKGYSLSRCPPMPAKRLPKVIPASTSLASPWTIAHCWPGSLTARRQV